MGSGVTLSLEAPDTLVSKAVTYYLRLTTKFAHRKYTLHVVSRSLYVVCHSEQALFTANRHYADQC